MSLRKKASLIIYRFKERGLEVFLINEKDENWLLPSGELPTDPRRDEMIALDPTNDDLGNPEDTWAVEGDWHEIPSLKGMLYEDAQQLRDKLREIERGAYVTIKDALKKVLPKHYETLKELKDILTDRNSLRDL